VNPFARWTWARIARLVGEALAETEGPVAVIGAPALAGLLGEGGRRVITVADRRRTLRGWRGPRLAAAAEALPVGDGSLGAVVAVGAAALGEWARAVKAGGVVLVVDAGAREEATRRALCAGQLDIEQRRAGRRTLTWGRVGSA
jgi:hypothetical protein